MKINKQDTKDVIKWTVLVIIEGIIQNYIMPTISEQNKTVIMILLKYITYGISIAIGIWLFYLIVVFIVKKITQKQCEEIELLKGCVSALVNNARGVRLQMKKDMSGSFDDQDIFYEFMKKKWLINGAILN